MPASGAPRGSADGQLRAADLLRAVPRERPRLRRPAAAGRGHHLLLRPRRRPAHAGARRLARGPHDRPAATRSALLPQVGRRRGASATTSISWDASAEVRSGSFAHTSFDFEKTARRPDDPARPAAGAGRLGRGRALRLFRATTPSPTPASGTARRAAGGRPGRASRSAPAKAPPPASPPGTASRSPAIRARTRTPSIWCARSSTSSGIPPIAAATRAARTSRSIAAGSPPCRPTCPTARR